MINIRENTVDLASIPTLKTLRDGDTFFILSGDYENEPFIMTDEDFVVCLIDGYVLKCDEDCMDLPVCKVDIDIIIRNA